MFIDKGYFSTISLLTATSTHGVTFLARLFLFSDTVMQVIYIAILHSLVKALFELPRLLI